MKKYLFIAIYVLVVLLVIIYAWNQQKSVRRGSDNPLYRNLMENEAYIKRGFNLSDINQTDTFMIPAESEWFRFEKTRLNLRNSPLPDLPKRIFLDPRGNDPEEFTIIIPVEFDNHAVSYLRNNPYIVPGMNFAGIGENWEIYFNGTLVQSGMHDFESRAWRNLYFPFDSSLIVSGTNMLALRIIGDPTFVATGLVFHMPHYIDDFKIIQSRQKNASLIVLGSVFVFAGIYYLMTFLFLRKKSEVFYLYFSIFSILLSIYSFTRHSIINILIPNGNVSFRLEYFGMILLVPFFCLFIETMVMGKTTRMNRLFLYFCLFLALSQLIFSNQYAEDAVDLWNITALLYFGYFFFYKILFYHYKNLKNSKNKENPSRLAPNTQIVIAIVSMGFLYVCSIYEVLQVMFLGNDFSIFQYSLFAIHIGIIFSLAQRFSEMYRKLEQTNLITQNQLELTEIRYSLMVSQIQPHFIYNTLTTIENLCRKNSEMAAKLTHDFSNYLRVNMDSLTQKELVSFEREMEFIKGYLEIEKMRFKDRLHITYDFEVTDFMLPILSVQPLVENAVRHGVTKKISGGTVTISTRRVNESVKIVVSDNGAGFDPEHTETIDDGRSHVGIQNVRERIKIRCGGTLTIESTKGKGTVCTIIIPHGGGEWSNI